jgi:RNA polymerase sigma factor (sigma-70 family)
MKPENRQIEVCRSFNGYCKKTLRNEACNAHKAIQRRQLNEMNFSEVNFDEEKLLLWKSPGRTEDNDFRINGKRMTLELLSKATNMLSENLRETIQLYYFFEWNDTKLSKLLNIPRSTVQNRRARALTRLRFYMEEYADVWDDL